MTDDAMNEKQEAIQKDELPEIPRTDCDVSADTITSLGRWLFRNYGKVKPLLTPSPVTPDASGLPEEIYVVKHEKSTGFWTKEGIERNVLDLSDFIKYTRTPSSLAELEAEKKALFKAHSEQWNLASDRLSQIWKLESQVEALQAKLDKRTKALEDINANASDAGSSKGKTGTDWIAAACREISEEALTDKEESGNG